MKRGGIVIADRRALTLTAYAFWCVLLFVLISLFLDHLPVWFNFIAYTAAAVLNVAGILFALFGKRTLFRLCVTVVACVTVAIAVYAALDAAGALDIFTDVERIREFVQSAGMWGMAIFVLIQVAQVAVLPIPGVLPTLAGVALYGAATAFILSLIGTVIGSIIAFSMGKIFGKSLVDWIAGRENADKYRRLFNRKGRFLFIMMLLFPVFPDDMLCMVAGLTAMTYPYFIIAVLLTRPWGIAATCFFGSGDIIPFSGWGIPVWGVIFLAVAAIFYIINKYKEKIAAYFKKKFFQKKS